MDELAQFAYLAHYQSPPEYYMGSITVGDTLCVIFDPQSPCSVFTAEAQWIQDGTIRAFVWRYNPECERLYPDGIIPQLDTVTVSPCGDLLFGPFETQVEATTDYSVLEPFFTREDQADSVICIPDGGMFVVGITDNGVDPFPSVLLDDVSFTGASHTWMLHPALGDSGWWINDPIISNLFIEAMLRVGVEYYGPFHPIRGMTRLSNTIDRHRTCTIHAKLLDDNGWTTDTGNLLVSINGGEPAAYPMTGPDPDTTFTGTFTLDCQPGDEITYWIEILDDEGNRIDNDFEAVTFSVITLDTSADFLVVLADSTGPRGQVIRHYLGNAGVNVAYWNPVMNKGIDASVVGNDWQAVLLFDPESAQLPLRGYGEDAYSGYLEGGGSLMIASNNLFEADDGGPAITFQPGDFAYDFLGIREAVIRTDILDSLFAGDEGSNLTRPFSEEPFVTVPSFYPPDTFPDAISPVTDARMVFTGFEHEGGYGIQVSQGETRRAVFSFDIAAACEQVGVDSDGNPILHGSGQFETLMDNLLGWMWLGADNPPQAAPLNFRLGSVHPNPFNAETRIEFTLPRAQRVTISVHDILGRRVAILLDGPGRAGSQSLLWRPGNGVASGIYFLRLQSGGTAATRKLVLLK